MSALHQHQFNAYIWAFKVHNYIKHLYSICWIKRKWSSGSIFTLFHSSALNVYIHFRSSKALLNINMARYFYTYKTISSEEGNLSSACARNNIHTFLLWFSHAAFSLRFIIIGLVLCSVVLITQVWYCWLILIETHWCIYFIRDIFKLSEFRLVNNQTKFIPSHSLK